MIKELLWFPTTAFLCSNEASKITGVALEVDGGQSI